MSGFVAMVRFDGASLDRALFDSMAESIRFRGPDGEGTWIGEQAAFAHSLLANTPQAGAQPVRRGELVIAGDIRIDAREELAETDPELLLSGYERWGESLLDRFIGDFTFAIWDGANRRLFAARDRFARKPLFYAHHDGALILTNNLPTLLGIPGLADDLDDDAVTDFLLFGRNLHAQRTTFARISRVPAAHFLIATEHGIELRRYWSIPMREEPRRISERDAQAEYREVMTRAVLDRARADRIVISLSGGLDSNAVAATLTQHRAEGVTALTTVWNELFEDEEGRYAKLAAQQYGIPIEFFVADRCEAFEGWDDPRVAGLEPTDEPCSALYFKFIERAAAHGRVILTGEGGDPALYTPDDYFVRLLKRFRWFRFVRDAAGYAITRHRRPPLQLRSALLRAFGRRRGVPDYPDWIRGDVRGRWEELYGPPKEPVHPYRGNAWRMIDSATWARTFEANDAGASGRPIEWLSPYFDVRVIELLFSLPPMPHFANKDIVRQAMAGRIPDEVRFRKKTPLPLDPSAVRFDQARRRWASLVESTPELDRWVMRPHLCSAILAGGSQYRVSQQAFAVSLALWLRNRHHPSRRDGPTPHRGSPATGP